MSMRYVALRPLKIPDGAGVRQIEAGDEATGASDWRHLQVWIDTGAIRAAFPGELDKAKPSTPAKPESPKPEPAAQEPAGENAEDALGALASALAAAKDDPASYTIAELADLAKKADLDLPDKLPRTKAGAIETIAGIAGLEV